MRRGDSHTMRNVMGNLKGKKKCEMWIDEIEDDVKSWR